jgi:transcriptional regulator with XRE-family HTH domain
MYMVWTDGSSTNLVNIDLIPQRYHFGSMLTPEQCRAARGLLGWTQEKLADKAGVSRGTVRGFERGHHDLHRASAAVIRAALEAEGVVMIDADEMGPGVRLQSSPER